MVEATKVDTKIDVKTPDFSCEGLDSNDYNPGVI